MLYPGWIKNHAIYICVRLEVQIQTFLNSILDGDEWLSSHPEGSAFEEKVGNTQLKRKTVLAQGGVDTAEREKKTCPFRESNRYS